MPTEIPSTDLLSEASEMPQPSVETESGTESGTGREHMLSLRQSGTHTA